MGQGNFFCKRPARESFRAPWVKRKPPTSKRTFPPAGTSHHRPAEKGASPPSLYPELFQDFYSPSTHFPRGHREVAQKQERAQAQDQGISLRAQAAATASRKPPSNAWAIPPGSTCQRLPSS